MADQRLQGNDGAALLVHVCDDCGGQYAPEIFEVCGCLDREGARHLTEIQVVPLSVAENLATALERVRPIIGSDVLHAEVERALAEFRGAHPRQDFDARAAGRRAVEKHEDALGRLAADQAHPREETTG